MSDIDVDLIMYTDQVVVQVNNATDRSMKEVAFGIEAGTKAKIQANGQIDTGFMMNSTYTIVRSQGSSYGQAWGSGKYRSRKTGQTVQRNLASQRSLPSSDVAAAIVVGADYAIYQEQRRSFLYAAAEAIVRSVGGTVQQVFKSFGF